MNYNNLKNILPTEFDPKLLVIFGSVATNTSHSDSDIDIAFLTGLRLPQHILQELIMKISQLSGFNNVNLIDLYYKDTPSLLQHEIFLTGKMIFEEEANLFENEKLRAINTSSFKNQDLNKLIIKDKIHNLEEIVTSLNKEPEYLEDKIINDAAIFKALKAIESAIKLNRFILNKFYNKKPNTNLDSFIELTKSLNLQNNEQSTIEILAETSMLKNYLSIDYYHGPNWSITRALRIIKDHYPAYIQILDSNKFLS